MRAKVNQPTEHQPTEQHQPTELRWPRLSGRPRHEEPVGGDGARDDPERLEESGHGRRRRRGGGRRQCQEIETVTVSIDAPPGTRGEAVGAAAPSAASSPTPTVATPSTPAVPGPDIAKDPRSETVETLKRLIGYIPEVRLGKAIVRWVKSQPPVDPGSRPLKPESPQAQ